jgi:peptide/nickel transport system permease protein
VGRPWRCWPRDFVLAARVAGKGRARISVEHILPNLASLMIVQGRSSSRSASWPRRGCPMWAWCPAPDAKLGRMLADAQTMVAIAPQMAIFPGLAIVLTVLGLNLLGDGLRDALDPRIRAVRA